MWTDDRIVDAEDDGAIVIRHDARSLPLEDGTVDLIVTSPPYFALRSYRDDGVDQRIWSSGHFAKTEQRTWQDRQTQLL